MKRLLPFLLVACGPSVAIDDDGGDGETSSSSSTTEPTSVGTVGTSATTATTATTTATTATTTVSTTSADESTSTDTTSDDAEESAESDFITPPDGSCFTVCVECDVWAQDCQDGDKCMAWANDGGDIWTATKCSPVANEPALIGDPCTVEGSGVSGIDNCEYDAICWGVDPLTNEGTCVPRCTGSEANPQCPDGLECMIAFESPIIVCLPPCDPLAPACAADEFCSSASSNGPQFLCQPTPPFEPQPYGAPCEGLLLCDSGYVCTVPEDVPGCVSDRCCTQLGATESPPPCDQGQSCIPLEEPNEALCYCGVP